MSSDPDMNNTDSPALDGNPSPESGVKVEIEGISLSLEGNLAKFRELFRLRDHVQVIEFFLDFLY